MNSSMIYAGNSIAAQELSPRTSARSHTVKYSNLRYINRFGLVKPGTGSIVETTYTAGERGFRAQGPDIARRMDLSQAKVPYTSPVSPDSPGYDPSYSGYFDPNEDPSYGFQFDTPTYKRQEVADSKGDVKGSYSFLDDVGEQHDVAYEAGTVTGFRVNSPYPESKVFNGLFYRGPESKPGGPPRGRTSFQRAPDGSYKFSANGPDQRRFEQSDGQGRVRGSYTYLDDKGQQRTVEYIAGPDIGYKILRQGLGPVNPSVYPYGLPEYVLPTLSPTLTGSKVKPTFFPSTTAFPPLATNFDNFASNPPTFSPAFVSKPPVFSPTFAPPSPVFSPAFAPTPQVFSPTSTSKPFGSNFQSSDNSLTGNSFQNSFSSGKSPSKPSQGGIKPFAPFKPYRPSTFGQGFAAAAEDDGKYRPSTAQPPTGGFQPDQNEFLGPNVLGPTPQLSAFPEDDPSIGKFPSSPLTPSFQPANGNGFLEVPFESLPGQSSSYPGYNVPSSPQPSTAAPQSNRYREDDNNAQQTDNDFLGFPRGVAVRAHVQSLDILPFGSRIPPPGEAIEHHETSNKSR